MKGWDDKAEAAWKEAIARDPRFAPARYRLGRLYLERAFFGTIGISTSQQKWKLPEATRWAKEAEAQLREALASGGGLDDDLQRTLVQAMQAYVAGDHEKAKRLCDEGRKAHAHDAGAIADFDEAIRRAPTHAPSLAEYDAALKVDPDSPEANADRGVCLLQLGDLALAAASLEKALAKAPADWPERAKMEEALRQARQRR